MEATGRLCSVSYNLSVMRAAMSARAEGAAHGATDSMNVAFALDELQQDAYFLSAEEVSLEMEDPMAPASPTGTIGLAETLDAFLREMEQLCGEIDTGNGSSAPSQSRENVPDSVSAAQVAVSSAQVPIATTQTKPKQKAKKLSSLERTRKQKAMAQHEIWSMEQQIKRIRRERDSKFEHIYIKHWQPLIQRELHHKEIASAQQLQLRRRIEKQQQKAQKAMQVTKQMLASFAAFTRIPFQPQLECEKDNSIFQMLAQRLASKSHCLDHVLPTKPTASEMSFGKVSADSAVAEHEFVCILPFDMPTASQVTWRGVESAFGSLNAGLNKSYAAGTQAIKQEQRVSVSDHLAVQMKIQAIIKQVVSGDRSILTWEGLIQWRTPADTLIAATHEFGTIAIESLADTDGLSAVKGFVRLTPMSTNDTWLHVARNMAQIVLPSYQKVMDGRQQYVENHLIDTASACSAG